MRDSQQCDSGKSHSSFSRAITSGFAVNEGEERHTLTMVLRLLTQWAHVHFSRWPNAQSGIGLVVMNICFPI